MTLCYVQLLTGEFPTPNILLLINDINDFNYVRIFNKLMEILILLINY